MYYFILSEKHFSLLRRLNNLKKQNQKYNETWGFWIFGVIKLDREISWQKRISFFCWKFYFDSQITAEKGFVWKVVFLIKIKLNINVSNFSVLWDLGKSFFVKFPSECWSVFFCFTKNIAEKKLQYNL